MLLDVAHKSPAATAPALGRPRAVLWIASFPVVLCALLTILTMLTIRARFSDPDLWWHLKTGEIIWNTHHIPAFDSYSYTTNNHAYIPHEWLAQLSIYAAYHFGGYTGLMLWFSLFASLLVVAGYVLSGLYSGNLKVAFLGGLITWLFSTIGLSIRPQLIGYLFLVALLIVIHLGQSRGHRWFFAMPPLFAIWINCHGSFFLGLVVLGATLACSMIELKWGLLVSQRWEKKQRNTFASAAALSVAALFLNPIGLKQVTYPLDTLFHQNVQMNGIQEWQPPSFNNVRGVALLAVAGLILLVPLLRRSQVMVQELVFLALGLALTIPHQRMLFVFGILAAPILCRLLAESWERYEPDRDRYALNAVLIAILLCIVVKVFPNRQELTQQVEKANPVKAVEYINRAQLSGNMFNDYVYGGYLIWAAPKHKVFVDGRGDVFEWSGVLEEYGKWATLGADPNVLLDKYKIGFCLLPAASPMSRVMGLLPGWTKAYSDDIAVVWARSSR